MKSATIRIEGDRPIGTIDRKVYGNFLEMLDRAVYGGVFEPGSSLSDEEGFRRDVMAAVRELGVTVLRWPGGNFASAYHWTDGIGPQEDRPVRFDPAWRTEYPNSFGTPEFLRYCGLIGADPFLCINAGTGTIDEARDWLEYCNSDGNTAWVKARRRDGHEEPYGVRYWALGNEIYGNWQVGQKTAAEYAKFGRECAKVMRATDPSVKLVSCGQSGWSEFDEVVLNELAPFVDMHSIHIYTGSDNHLLNTALPLAAEQSVLACQWMIHCALARRGLDKRITIAYDEWNVWYHGDPRHEESYDLSDALAVAVYLNVFQRHCDIVEIACLAQLVNVLAPILTSPEGMLKHTIFHPLALYAREAGGAALHAGVVCEAYAAPVDEHGKRGDALKRHRMDEVPYLDVSATLDPDSRTVALFVVNRHETEEITASIENAGLAPRGEAQVTQISGDDPHAGNSFETPDVITPAAMKPVPTGQTFEYAFAPLSLTLLKYAV